MSRQVKVLMTPDHMSSTLRIEICIPEVFTATHFFALQQFENVFMSHNAPMSNRLRALADFIEHTQEKKT